MHELNSVHGRHGAAPCRGQPPAGGGARPRPVAARQRRGPGRPGRRPEHARRALGGASGVDLSGADPGDDGRHAGRARPSTSSTSWRWPPARTTARSRCRAPARLATPAPLEPAQSRAAAAATRSSVAVSATRTCRAPAGAVERAGRDQDPEVGQVGDGLPAVLVAGRPEVERRLGVVDPEAAPSSAPAASAAAARSAPAARRRARRRPARRPSPAAAGRAASGRGSCGRRAARPTTAGSPATKPQR